VEYFYDYSTYLLLVGNKMAHPLLKAVHPSLTKVKNILLAYNKAIAPLNIYSPNKKLNMNVDISFIDIFKNWKPQNVLQQNNG
jgi:hypothetical protein